MWNYTYTASGGQKSAVHLTILVFHQISGLVLSPYSAPSIGAFGEIGPIGARQGCRAFSEGQGWPFRKPSAKARSTGNWRNVGWPFLWILSFGHAKESIAVVGPRTDIKITVALATQNLNQMVFDKPGFTQF
ncbi:hypothetical protein A1353_11545 [Methylomonas methanica]|uniref:Uncharacterized protein n=1 Tax=Methylomonas methanica TaxID=421 RepID=A0A177MJ87_METMH|nr:hypothetical protein A1353_11545 [Methylomonas methanica]